MNSAPIRSGQRFQAASQWFAVFDLVLAICAVVFAVPLPWILEPHAVGFVASLFILLTAAAFIVASVALKRGWHGRWPLQIVGPALALYLLFGLSWALAVIIFGAVLCVSSLALHWAKRNDS